MLYQELSEGAGEGDISAALVETLRGHVEALLRSIHGPDASAAATALPVHLQLWGMRKHLLQVLRFEDVARRAASQADRLAERAARHGGAGVGGDDAGSSALRRVQSALRARASYLQRYLMQHRMSLLCMSELLLMRSGCTSAPATSAPPDWWWGSHSEAGTGGAAASPALPQEQWPPVSAEDFATLSGPQRISMLYRRTSSLLAAWLVTGAVSSVSWAAQ